MRSLATRESDKALSAYVQEAIDVCKAAAFDFIILESALEKIDMLDFADIIAVNKFDKKGAADALKDVKKQFQRNHKLFDKDPETMPVYGTIASQFNDPGMNTLYRNLLDLIDAKTGSNFKSDFHASDEMSEKVFIIPPSRNRYLSEISETVRKYNSWTEEQAEIAEKLYQLQGTKEMLSKQ